MDLKTAKKVTNILMIVLLINVFAGWLTEKTIFSMIAIGIICFQGFIFMAYWNCPSCGRNLGKMDFTPNNRYCSHCGEEIKM